MGTIRFARKESWIGINTRENLPYSSGL